MLPDDAHIRLSGRYHAVTTAWPYLGMRMISHFHSKQHLVESVVSLQPKGRTQTPHMPGGHLLIKARRQSARTCQEAMPTRPNYFLSSARRSRPHTAPTFRAPAEAVWWCWILAFQPAMDAPWSRGSCGLPTRLTLVYPHYPPPPLLPGGVHGASAFRLSPFPHLV